MDVRCRQNAINLLMELKIIGMEMSSEMNLRQNKDFYQYLTACIITSEELRMGTFSSLIQKVKTEFHGLVAGNKQLNVKERYLRFKRFVMLQNFKDKDGINQHTEARLFDVTGRIRKSLKQASDQETAPDAALEENDKDTDGFLTCMKRELKELFGDTDDYYIVVFSHFLPCTQPDHLCASLIGRFSVLTKQHIIISYEMPYMTTEETKALDSMKSQYITIINIYPKGLIDHQHQQGNGSQYNTDFFKTHQRRPVVNYPRSNYFYQPAIWIADGNYNRFQDPTVSTWNTPSLSYYHRQLPQDSYYRDVRISSDIPRKVSLNQYDLWIRQLPPVPDHYIG